MATDTEALVRRAYQVFDCHIGVAAMFAQLSVRPDFSSAVTRELTGAERDRIYAEQARRYAGFAGYARQTAGVRTIPVLELSRV
jgi:hypothetical protein